MKTHQTYTAVIEQDTATGLYVAYVPELAGAHTQGATLAELRENLREVIELVLADDQPAAPPARFVGTQRISV